MKKLCWMFRPMGIVLTFSFLFLVVPIRPCIAALIGTESVINNDVREDRQQQARQALNRFFATDQVRNVLTSRGISDEEAKARVDALTDAEAIALAKKIDNLPSGGDGGSIIGAMILIFFVLLITDILGLTDVFPFVKKHGRR